MADDIEKDANLSLVELDKGETLNHFLFSSQVGTHSHSHCLSVTALTVLYYQLSSGVVRLAHDD